MRASAAIASLTVGWLALSRAQEGVGRVERREGAAALSPASRKLLEEQARAAMEVSDMELERVRLLVLLKPESLPFEPIVAWSRRAMEARLRLALDDRQRLDAIREHRRRAVLLERIVGDYSRTGQCRITEVPRARYYRLEADRLLIEAGGDPANEKEEAAADLAPKGPSQPPPPPVSR